MSPFVAAALLALVAVSSAITLEDCQAKPETGLCRGYFWRHFWNATSGQCEEFVYGGCGGNLNNFESHEECHSTCDTLTQNFASDCESQSEVGMCRGKFPRYFYNQQSGQCESFTYGGCGGNNNNYKSLEECQATCQPAVQAADVQEVECTAEPEKGPCRAAFHKFFFNKHTGKCHPFTYGGCQGNTNKFATEQECQQQCGQTQVERVDCGEKQESGFCKALIPAFYYNAKSGNCEHFFYGGCGGNTNRFYTYESCHATCQGYEAPETNEVEEPKEWTLKNCFLEPVTGNCLAAIPRYHFNRRTGLCEQFIYGGCNGNENNFATEKDCYDHCLVL